MLASKKNYRACDAYWPEMPMHNELRLGAIRSALWPPRLLDGSWGNVRPGVRHLPWSRWLSSSGCLCVRRRSARRRNGRIRIDRREKHRADGEVLFVVRKE